MHSHDSRFGAALWASAFRPFFLAGTGYGLVFLAFWAGAWAGWWAPPPGSAALPLWHGHEMLFGFAAAIILGITLTALPSWAGTAEIRGAPLAFLVALWATGRGAVWAAAWLPPWLVGGIDAALFLVAAGLLAPQLLRARNRLYLLVLPIFVALALANGLYHFALAAGPSDPALAGTALRAALYAVIVLYVLKGGVLTAIFTGNALREKGRGEQASFEMSLEIAAAGLVVVLAGFDLAGAPALPTGLAALACAAVHAWRTARWRGWRVADVPLVLFMHLGFAWLVFAFLLKAAAELAGIVPEAAWVHAFTLGSLGMMMLGLMLRVSLRHTGRPLQMPAALRLAAVALSGAALVRLAASVHGLGQSAILIAAGLWLAGFALYLVRFGPLLYRPGLQKEPRKQALADNLRLPEKR
jgi:uncharacterized protein involved in response to NO